MIDILKKLLIVILVFTILPFGFEILRWKMIENNLNEDIEIMMLDSIELTMIGQYRNENISKINPTECERKLIDAIKSNLRLDSNLNPIGEHYLASTVNITQLSISEGDYYISGGMPVQIINPSIRLEANTSIKALILGIDKKIPVRIKVFVENKRVK